MKNLILITIDCFRADYATLFRNILSIKPKIMLSNFFSVGTFTGFSIPSILTSEYPPVIMPKNALPLFLKKKGYTTLAFVTNPLLLTQLGFLYNIRRGFDVFKYYPGQISNIKIHEFFARIIDHSLKFLGRTALSQSHMLIHEKLIDTIKPLVSFLPILLPYEKAINILQDVLLWAKRIKKPYFIWIHLNDLHTPIVPYTMNSSFVKELYIKKLYLGDKFIYLGSKVATALRKLYIRSLIELDYLLYRFIINIFKKDRKTIVVITSDHGEQFLEHGGIDHVPQNLYEEQIKIPCIILGIDQRKDLIINKLASTIDLPKTLCNILGIRNNFNGIDILDGNEINKYIFIVGHKEMYYNIDFSKYSKIKTILHGFLYAIRTKRWKIIYGKKGFELYNLYRDPTEKINMFEDMYKSAIALNLKHQLKSETRKHIRRIIIKLRLLLKTKRIQHYLR